MSSADEEKQKIAAKVVEAVSRTRTIIDRATSDGKWGPVVQSLVADLYGEIARLNGLLEMNMRFVAMCLKQNKYLKDRLEAGGAAAEPDEAPAAAPAPATVNGMRTGADGLPLSPEEAALEAQMDAAINGGGGAELAPHGPRPAVGRPGGPPPAGRPHRQQQAAPTPAPDAAPAAATDPDAVQANLEAQMDAAISTGS